MRSSCRFIRQLTCSFLALYALTSCASIDGKTAVTENVTTIERPDGTSVNQSDNSSRVPATVVVPPSPVAAATITPSPSPSRAFPTTASTQALLPTLTPTTVPQLFLPVKTASNFGSVNEVASSDDGRYTVVKQGIKLSLYNAHLDEAIRIGPAKGVVEAADIAPDGRTIAYWGTINTLRMIPSEEECRDPASQYCGDLFIYDVAAGTTVTVPFGIRVGGIGGLALRVSVASNGAVAVAGDGVIHSGTFLVDPTGDLRPISSDAIAASLSGDGRYLAYMTGEGAFVYDVESDSSEQITAESPGLLLFHEGATASIDISDDGRFVVFVSERANFSDAAVEPCTDYMGRELPVCRHVYLIDRQSGERELISVADSGQPANGVGNSAYISPDGRFVAFDSFASNLTDLPVCGDDFTACPQVYLRDRQEGRTYLLSRPASGEVPDGESFVTDFSGEFVSIVSGASNLNGTVDTDPWNTRKAFLVNVLNYLTLIESQSD